MNMNGVFQVIGRKSGRFLKNNASTILSCLGTVGVVATAALAVKATPKAMELIRSDSRVNHDGDPDAFTKEEAVKSCWKCYVPAATVGAGTIVCILSSNILSRKQQAALVSSYGLIGKAYGEYQKKVKEKCGKETHDEILREIAAEKSKGRAPFIPGCMEPASLAFDELEEDEILIYDQVYSGRYLQVKPSMVLQAEYHLNRNLSIRGEVTLNEFYELLDVDPVPEGDSIGWVVCDEFTWLDFDHIKADLDDRLPCWIISSEFPPGPPDSFPGY